jgi:hypothetical protein
MPECRAEILHHADARPVTASRAVPSWAEWTPRTGPSRSRPSVVSRMSRYSSVCQFGKDASGGSTYSGADAQVVMEGLAVAYARRLINWAVVIGERTGWRGSWVLGLHGDGLRGLGSYLCRPDLGYIPTFDEPEFREIITASHLEMVQASMRCGLPAGWAAHREPRHTSRTLRRRAEREGYSPGPVRASTTTPTPIRGEQSEGRTTGCAGPFAATGSNQ